MDERFAQSSGVEMFNGNELIVKGGLEGAVALVTGYPGSPVAEVFDVCKSINSLLREQGILAELANNEALGAARLNGAQMAGIRGMAVMKNVGLHVAADAVAISNMAGTHPEGGALVVVGDDPWNSSTQVPADSRYLAKHLFLPVIEPSTFQELKDWVGIAFDLSARCNLYICYLVVTNLADGGGTVTLKPNRYPVISTRTRVLLDPAQVDNQKRIVLPPDTTLAEADLLKKRFPKLLEEARHTPLNRVLYAPGAGAAPLGFVTSGLNYTYLEHALRELGLAERFPILKLGMTYPLDAELIRSFARQARVIVVIEEKRGFLEEHIRDILAQDLRNGAMDSLNPIWGKQFPGGEGISELKGLHPSLVTEKLIALFRAMPELGLGEFEPRWTAVQESYDALKRAAIRLPLRLPTFCPGCPHRDSGSVFEELLVRFKNPEYMRKQHGCDPVSVVFHGDIGCYAMFKYPPFDNLMHNMSGMGLGGGTGAGIDPFIRNKQVVFVGDGTFFHSEMIAISDSIKNHQDITYIILDNKTTAMTGHQSTPGIHENVMGDYTVAQDIERALEGLGEELFLVRTNPENRESYATLLERTILKDGVKVIVADKECGITYGRKVKKARAAEVKREGFLREEVHVNVTEEVCENCLECTKKTACPGLTFTETPYGRKVQIDFSNCVQDLACARVKACPSFEKVIIERTNPPRRRAVGLPDRTIPEPAVRRVDGEPWYAYMSGVGGMGIGVISTILSRAGMREGYAVHFNNKKGLAIRNGAVFAHIAYLKEERPLSPLVPWGKADLLLGLDLVETARAVVPGAGHMVAGPHTVCILNTAKVHTISTLIDRDTIDAAAIEDGLRRATDASRYVSADLFEIAERFLENRVYANLLLLGIAWQQGAIPLAQESMLWAIQRTVKPDDVERNIQAFKLGRHLAVFPRDFALRRHEETAQELFERKFQLLAKGRGFLIWGHDDGPAVALEYQRLCEFARAMMKQLSDRQLREVFRRIYDCLQWDHFQYAERYLKRVIAVYEKDAAARDYAMTQAVAEYLAKVMCIKDEVYVAELLVSDEKIMRDRERYNIDPANGDRVRYVHLNRPHFDIGPFHLEFNLNTRNWMLKLMRKQKWLRRWLPSWHSREKAMRDWYEKQVDACAWKDDRQYRLYTELFRLPETVRGYRDIRYPGMQEMYKKAESLLRDIREPGATPVPATAAV